MTVPFYCWCPGCGNMKRPAKAHYRMFADVHRSPVVYWETCASPLGYATEETLDETIRALKGA